MALEVGPDEREVLSISEFQEGFHFFLNSIEISIWKADAAGSAHEICDHKPDRDGRLGIDAFRIGCFHEILEANIERFGRRAVREGEGAVVDLKK